ncbi:Short chain dehydrogenase/reductase family 42E member 1 [Rhynchospora pubera]|uniref:Short chain dehydrogenase/reductase family 42E member 1 n=1 Tax=Rhynchospora pubera TaxID=906938 RepID=A0AAV8DEI4_9POAL|nr:Short chain dehydrogenase/reductase family 42E member 1 [Rhynchospora pubera]
MRDHLPFRTNSTNCQPREREREMKGVEGRRFVVTGGMGYVGSTLCLELLRRGAAEVRCFDFRRSSPWAPLLLDAGVRCIHGDVTCKDNVERAFNGVDCVLHLASFGMSGKEMVQTRRVEEVNIKGTCNVLDACHEASVKRLVYVSTYNVVFGGQEIINGDESMDYFPIDAHVDTYGRTKSVAEQLVLKSNGRPSKNQVQSCLYTCAIRPGAIYGPGEERHLPRILSLAKAGLLLFKIGDASIKTDWVYVDNLVHAIILASAGLSVDVPDKEGMPISAGQAYFICDGEPVNTSKFLIHPLLESLDYHIPRITLSVPLLFFVSRIFLFIYTTILSPVLHLRCIPEPLLLPAEVYKVGITHHFSIKKAREELGYTPLVSPQDGLAATIIYWRDRKRRELDGPPIFVWFAIIFGMIATFAAAFLPPVGPVKPVRALGLLIFRSVLALKILFVVAVGLHLGEGAYAWFLARKVDPTNAVGWFWQTVALGFPSLRLLLKRARTSFVS